MNRQKRKYSVFKVSFPENKQFERYEREWEKWDKGAVGHYHLLKHVRLMGIL